MAPPVLSSVMFQETFWSSLSAFLLCGSVHFSNFVMPHVATLTNTYTPEFAYLVDSTNTLLLTLFVLLVLLALPPFAGRAHYNPCVTIFNLFGGACTIDQAILRLFGQAAGAMVAAGLGCTLQRGSVALPYNQLDNLGSSSSSQAPYLCDTIGFASRQA